MKNDKNTKCYIPVSDINTVHNSLMEFIKRVSKGDATKEETQVLPQVALAFIELSKLHT